MQFDETGPNTHTRRYWVSATVGITAMIAFAILSVLLLLGMLFGSPHIKPIADSLFPWSLLVFAVAGVSMLSRTRVLAIRSTPTPHATDPLASCVRRCPHARIKLGA